MRNVHDIFQSLCRSCGLQTSNHSQGPDSASTACHFQLSASASASACRQPELSGPTHRRGHLFQLIQRRGTAELFM